MSSSETKEIVKLIDGYKAEHKSLEDSITTLEEELGDCDDDITENRILKQLDRAEEKKQSVERMIFDLQIKKTELSYLSKDNKFKNNVGIISILISVLAAFGAIYLAFEQNNLNKKIYNVELISVTNLQGDIENRIKQLEDSKLDKINGSFTKEINELKKRLIEINKKIKK